MNAHIIKKRHPVTVYDGMPSEYILQFGCQNVVLIPIMKGYV